ncbi:MAG: TraR/DksA C4-type zinc finger protein [Planctomycetes bacterium]|jgi:DnaK suppressor protein|nr:TraR/DksA C4-type zinc finger protein [Planctomycetota bacterium]
MKKSDLLDYKEQLQAIRARLRGDVTTMADVALRKSGTVGDDSNSMPIHMAELGSDNYEQEFTLSRMESEGDTLGMIEAALVRVDAGSYGRCVECDGLISKTRLNAIPYTPVCIKCAKHLENR